MSAQTARDKLTQARTNLVLDQPFFGSLVLRLQLIEGRTKHMATDGTAIYYNAAFIDSLTMPQLQGLLCHEVLHCANGHPWRRGARDSKRFNEACDYAINPIIRASNMQLPDGGLEDAQYNGMPAEQIYSMLPLPPEAPGQGNGQSSGGSGQGESQGSGSGGDSDSDDEQGDSESDDQDDSDSDSKGQGNQGNGNGDSSQGDEESDVPGGVCDAADPEKASEEEADWQVATAQAAQSAKAQGKLPSELERFVAEALRPRVDWRAVLRRFVQETSRADYSWRNPSTRYIGMGLYLPHMRSENMPPIVIAVDTSGSIDDATLSAFAAEINAIVDETKPERVHVIYCDAAVHSVDTFEQGEDVVMHPKGGGGTDFRPVFDHVEQEQIEASCVIYLTDMYGTFPEIAPEYPVLWASTTRDYDFPFGEMVYIEPEVQS